MPGCTRYQCPSNIKSVTAPRNAAPTTTRNKSTKFALLFATTEATNPTAPIATATKSNFADFLASVAKTVKATAMLASSRIRTLSKKKPAATAKIASEPNTPRNNFE